MGFSIGSIGMVNVKRLFALNLKRFVADRFVFDQGIWRKEPINPD
jgi:hypothetical protein